MEKASRPKRTFRIWNARPGQLVKMSDRNYGVANDGSYRRIADMGPPVVLFNRKTKLRKKQRVRERREEKWRSQGFLVSRPMQ